MMRHYFGGERLWVAVQSSLNARLL
jgi:hypothetical protein